MERDTLNDEPVEPESGLRFGFRAVLLVDARAELINELERRLLGLAERIEREPDLNYAPGDIGKVLDDIGRLDQMLAPLNAATEPKTPESS